MAFKTSYSQSDCYKTCSQHWYWKYKEKLEGADSGASLFFGTAIDSAVMYLLETGKEDFKDKFIELWFRQEGKKEAITIFDNPNIIYSYSDFDKDVLTDDDLFNLEQVVVELEMEDRITKELISTEELSREPKALALYNTIVKIKKNPYKRCTEKELRFFNRVSWIAMRRKGLILLDSFFQQFYPKIEQVIATQKFSILKAENTGDIIQGVVDMVLKLKGMDKPVIFDLKTAGKPYTQEQIEHSDQLTLYAAMEGHKYQTDYVGYVVLSKNIEKTKEKYCKLCSNKSEGRHKTCSKEMDKKRCGGEWEEKLVLTPKVQVLIEKKSPEQIHRILEEQSNIINAMQHNVVFRNTSKCNSWYGGPCVYYNLCHKRDKTGLKKKG